MKKALIAATAAFALSGAAATAERWDPVEVKIDNGENDIGFGLGLSWSLGANAKPGVSVGVKAFSRKRSDSFAASAGVDFNLFSKSIRPNVGVAYLAHHEYIDLNYGYDLGDKAWSFGLGTGYVETARDSIELIYDQPS